MKLVNSVDEKQPFHSCESNIESCNVGLKVWMKSYQVTQMKATEQYFPVVLFSMLYKVVLTFESVDEILKCDHSSKSY